MLARVLFCLNVWLMFLNVKRNTEEGIQRDMSSIDQGP